MSKTRSPSTTASDGMNMNRSRMKAWMETLWGGSKEDARNAFVEMRDWWAGRVPPVTRMRRIDGVATPVEGWAMPQEILDLVMQLESKNISGQPARTRYNLLNIAVARKASTLTEWALLGGWNPNFYGSRVTPVGQAIYTGDLKSLILMRDFGADLVLELRAEHGNADRPLLDRDVGSTALHRVMEKPAVGNTKTAIVELLVAAYPDPLPRTRSGETPLDRAIDHVGVDEIRREVARREHLAMTAWARTALDTDSAVARPRARL